MNAARYLLAARVHVRLILRTQNFSCIYVIEYLLASGSNKNSDRESCILSRLINFII